MKPTSAVDEKNVIYVPTTQGVRIPVRAYGTGTKGVPLVMLHGIQSHSGWFTQSSSFLANLGMPVYAMDRYGSGMSKAPRGGYRSLEESIKDIDSVVKHAMDKHKMNNVHLLGHCYGAMLAAAYACENNYKLRSLILPTPAIFTKSDVTPSEKLKILWSKISGRDLMIPVPLGAEMMSDTAEYVTFIKNDKLSLHEASGRFFFEVARMRRFIMKGSSGITAPVFMAFAGKDPICRNDENRRFFDSIRPDKKVLKVYDDARHILEFSRERDNFFKDIAAWIDRLNK